MYSGLQQANQLKENTGNRKEKNAGLRVAFLQNQFAANDPHQESNRQTIFSSTSGYYYIDGIAVSASDTEESLLYREEYEWTESYY